MHSNIPVITRVALISCIVATWIGVACAASRGAPVRTVQLAPGLSASVKDEVVEGESTEGESFEGETFEGEATEGEPEFRREVIMPRLEHRTLEEAHALLESYSLALGQVTHKCDSMLAAGVVIRQEPDFGTHVLANTEVDLVVSTGRCVLGCDSYDLNDWENVFLGALVVLVLFTLGLFVGEEEFVNPFDFM